ncbi:hypothetical protein FOL47_006626 [Perkinsus chesapeaki]|uniref:PITH domain-containing protein n=1 Tax=Perkinsus chesapeaki TaxID=330153 RepID=A0A7J6LR14_PERCH|nr:hypothetical protein FOL47_006626 [Perkinsus chesapeaki]
MPGCHGGGGCNCKNDEEVNDIPDDRIICKSEDDDANIVVHVVFECPVKITSLLIIGGDDGHSPNKVRLLANHPNPDFATITECGWETQSLDLVEDFCGSIEYPVKVAKFANVSSLSMHFPSNNRPDDDEDISTILHWIGIKGVASGTKRSAVVSVYESQANVKDHEVKDDALGGMNLGVS